MCSYNISSPPLVGLARAFLTRESFFTTQVKNTSTYQSGDVLVAPSDPGGVALHRVVRGEELILTSGAYLAGDDNVNIASSVLHHSLGLVTLVEVVYSY